MVLLCVNEYLNCYYWTKQDRRKTDLVQPGHYGRDVAGPSRAAAAWPGVP